MNNESLLYERTFSPEQRPDIRREFWISIGMGKNQNDLVDYDSIKYAISLEEDLNLEGFKFTKSYSKLNLFEKSN